MNGSNERSLEWGIACPEITRLPLTVSFSNHKSTKPCLSLPRLAKIPLRTALRSAVEKLPRKTRFLLRSAAIPGRNRSDGGDSMARLPRKRQPLPKDRIGGADEVPVPEPLETADAASVLLLNQHSSVAESEKESSPEKPVRVYADGIYDLFHFGHARSLEQAKKLFPNAYLLVGCCNDEITHRYKGKTVMTEAERYESLRHCRWVDEVIPDAPWVITQDFIDKHKIDFVAHDSLPYADASGAGKDVYEFVKAVGKFMETKRTDGISTSDIIMRILKDYNQYVMRNLARGYSRKDLGVSYVKEKQLRVNMGITRLREKVKEHQEKVGQKLHTVAKTAGMHHNEWVENADRWVAGFLEKFEEGCHMMETAIKDRIQEGLKRQQSRIKMANLLREQVVS